MIVVLSEKGEDMLSIARRTAAGAAVLLVIPTVVWFSGWMWQPGQNETWLKALYWITETVTQPWGLLRTCCSVAGSCGACAFAFARRWYCSLFSAAPYLSGGGEVVGQDRVQEPRPFVVWLEKRIMFRWMSSTI